jgi:hypothetical protein
MFASTAHAQLRTIPTSISHIEPACWQVGQGADLVFQISGDHLGGVVGVKIKHKGVRVIHLQPEDDGHLKVTLHFASNAEPGTLFLQVFTKYMTTFVTLPMANQSASLQEQTQQAPAK